MIALKFGKVEVDEKFIEECEKLFDDKAMYEKMEY